MALVKAGRDALFCVFLTKITAYFLRFLRLKLSPSHSHKPHTSPVTFTVSLSIWEQPEYFTWNVTKSRQRFYKDSPRWHLPKLLLFLTVNLQADKCCPCEWGAVGQAEVLLVPPEWCSWCGVGTSRLCGASRAARGRCWAGRNHPSSHHDWGCFAQAGDLLLSFCGCISAFRVRAALRYHMVVWSPTDHSHPFM